MILLVNVILALWLGIGLLLAAGFSMEDGSCLTFKQRASCFFMVTLLWPVFFFLRDVD